MKYIVIHCAVTRNGSNGFTEKDIDSWHGERNFQRTEKIAESFNPHLKHIGYHFVILTNGDCVTGRAVGETGAHCPGANQDGIGICLMGTDKFTVNQWSALTNLVKALQNQYENKLLVRGHYQFDSAKKQGKTCPNFNAEDWYNKGMGQCGGHTLA